MSSSNDTVALLREILSRITALEISVGGNSGKTGVETTSSDTAAASVLGFDKYSTEFLNPFVQACTKLGGDAQKAGDIVNAAWAEQRKIIAMAAACKEPAQASLQSLLAGIGAKVKEATTIINRNEWEKHTKAVSEGMSCLNWVVVKPAPRDFIESSVGGSDYWANGIRKEFRGVNPDQIAFCDTFKALLTGLMAYVKEFHTTGLAWNAKGVDVSQFSAGGAPVVSSASGAAAVKATPAASTSSASTTGAPAKGDLFAALNKDAAVTSGLKKVTKDMQTWREEYKGDAAAPVVAKAITPKAPAAAAPLKGPAKLQFEEANSKWLVEYQTAAAGRLDIAINDKKETVYIFGCVGATVDIKGKCKSIVVDGCKQTKVYFDSAMASCEVVNCQRMQVHCRESVPAVALDKTDGVVVFLPRSSLNTEVVASKSSEMNISWPDEHGDMLEKPIPEQYVHRIKGTSVTADVSDLYTH